MQNGLHIIVDYPLLVSLLGYETCYYTQDVGASYRGEVSTHSEGHCLGWKVLYNPTALKMKYVLEHNYCRNVFTAKNEPFCPVTYSKDVGTAQECRISTCGTVFNIFIYYQSGE